NGSHVVVPRTDDRQRDAGGGGRQRREAHGVEVDARVDLHVVPPDKPLEDRGEGRSRQSDEEDREEPVVQPHALFFGRTDPELKRSRIACWRWPNSGTWSSA